MAIRDLDVKIFADGADLAGILDLAANPLVKGFTTNPTLMRQAGIEDYERFARAALEAVPHLPISFEVLSDDFDEMERQAHVISSWGENVYVKVPVTNTSGDSSAKLIERLAEQGIQLNVTALMTLRQVAWVAECLQGSCSSYVSVFAGRVADTGRDPVPMMAAAVELLRPYPHLELIWASPREILNILQADGIGCHIITVTHDLLKKLEILGRDLDAYSLDTVRMFHRDAQAAGFSL